MNMKKKSKEEKYELSEAVQELSRQLRKTKLSEKYQKFLLLMARIVEEEDGQKLSVTELFAKIELRLKQAVCGLEQFVHYAEQRYQQEGIRINLTEASAEEFYTKCVSEGVSEPVGSK
jgi:hypothetical protein